MVAPARKTAPESVRVHSLRHEAGALGLAVVGLLVALALLSALSQSRDNLVGPAGGAIADVLVQALGIAALAIPSAILWAAWTVFRGVWPGLTPARSAAAAGTLVASSALAQLALGTWRGLEAGGIVGGFSRALLGDAFGDAGAWLIALTGFALLLAIATGQSIFGVAAAAGRGSVSVARGAWSRARKGGPDPGPARGPVGEPILLRRSHEVPPDNVMRDAGGRRAPLVVTTPTPVVPARRAAKRQIEMPFKPGQAYCLPDASLLDPMVEAREQVDHEALTASSRVLEAKLSTFDIHGEVQAIHPGPVITTYHFEPAPGVRVGRIVALADDLAMAMRAQSVRILAPIPGQPYVGIEVSNVRREHVLLREIVMDECFTASPSPIMIALGKNTEGTPTAGDLAKMPHLLVAGATGAGKSVFLNTLITSILMRATPRDVRFVMIDPKMIELTTYERIPHLLVPVVTEAKPAVAVLNNLVKEMDERYGLLREKGVRNIDDYNRQIAAEGDAAPVIELDEEDDVDDEGGDEEAGESTGAPRIHQHLSRIVVIIDELADLITTRRDCEDPIARLAQKARAAGIHLVVATQRPSVDIITGVIKANFPARISFKTRQKVDSRTILDSMGAEHLLGDGDMLFLGPGKTHLQRLHGAFVSDGEIDRIVKFVARQATQSYRMELLEEPEGDDGDEGERDSADQAYDEMYDEAVRIVTESGKASISYVQRRLQVGYNRAARMIECMEREGVVTKSDHRGAREVIAQRIDD